MIKINVLFRKFVSCNIIFFSFLSSYAISNDNLNQKIINYDVGELVSRITYLEEKIRFLNGKVEEQEYLEKKINERFDLFEKNIKAIVANIQKTHSKSLDNQTVTNENDLKKSKAINQDNSLNIASKNYKNITTLLQNKKYDLAEKEMLNFVKEFNQDKLTAKVYFMLGELKYNKNLFESASLYYLYCQKNFPKSEYAAKALFKLSLSLEKIKKHNEMCVILKKILKDYPLADKKLLELTKDKQIKQKCIK